MHSYARPLARAGGSILPLLLLLASLEAQAGLLGAQQGNSREPRNVLHADFLPITQGKQTYGIYYERVATGNSHASFVLGVAAATEVEWKNANPLYPGNLDVDLVGLGCQLRYYGQPGWGAYGAPGLAITVGRGVDRIDPGAGRESRFVGYELSPLSLGYQRMLLRRVAIAIGLSLRLSYGWLRPEQGGGWYFIGNYAVILSGGAGLGF